eukprot:TRINITY_DN10450_c0_g1_i1.p1 TRINITY_DN10450_c0_g1~~TRINITY_DN10450_c0_g1_i1.p1  ORF type:complete len:239 (+),score=50.31 TRINITY_DN10450_c0_g1_i1:70-717(+)
MVVCPCCFGANGVSADDAHQGTHEDLINLKHEKEDSMIHEPAREPAVPPQVYGRCESSDKPVELSSEESLPTLLSISQSVKLSPEQQDGADDVLEGIYVEEDVSKKGSEVSIGKKGSEVSIGKNESEVTFGNRGSEAMSKKGSMMSVFSMSSSMSIAKSASLRAALDGASSAAVSVAKSKSLRDSLQGATNTLVHASGSLFAHPLSAVAKSKRRR